MSGNNSTRGSRNRINTNADNNNGNDKLNSYYLWGTAGVLGAIGAAALGYWYSRPVENPGLENRPTENQEGNSCYRTSQPNGRAESQSSGPSIVSNLCNTLSRLSSNSNSNSNGRMYSPGRRGIPRESIPENPVITNLNSLLSDIYVRYIALNDDEFEIHYRVFNEVFHELIKTMKEVDPYFKRYSSRKQFAGSHYDRLRIKKPDEFDMDIVVGLPLNINFDPQDPASSDIILEPKGSGFVQLKMGVQFQKLPLRDREEWLINRTAYEWKDERNYLLRDKFTNWFKSVVSRALNLHPVFYVDGIPYTIDRSESGPAMTLFIKNESKGFRMDVDLVPALKFPESRWPICGGYRDIPLGCSAKQQAWMVVPKPNKNATDEVDKLRSWRIAMHDQERGLMYNSQNMKQTIRLMKKLRDSLQMKEIASYYVKTLFFWVAIERRDDMLFWRKSPGELFTLMVAKLHEAMVTGNIPYFWNRSNNLIEKVSRATLNRYASKLSDLILVLNSPADYKQVARYLLSRDEFEDYNRKFLHI